MWQVGDTIAEGYAAQQVLLQFQGALLADTSLPDIRKAAALDVVAAADKSLVDGGDEWLQLLNVCSQVNKSVTAAA